MDRGPPSLFFQGSKLIEIWATKHWFQRCLDLRSPQQGNSACHAKGSASEEGGIGKRELPSLSQPSDFTLKNFKAWCSYFATVKHIWNGPGRAQRPPCKDSVHVGILNL